MHISNRRKRGEIDYGAQEGSDLMSASIASLLEGSLTFLFCIALVAVFYPFMDDFITDFFDWDSQFLFGTKVALIIFFASMVIVVPIIAVMGIEGSST